MTAPTTTPASSATLEFQADAKALRDMIARVAKAVSSRPSVQVLGGLKFDGADGVLYVTATDLTLTLRESIPATVSGAGEALVLDAKKVLAGLATLEGELGFSASAETFAVRNGTTTLRYPAVDVADFPVSPFTRETTAEIAVDREAFLAAFATVGVCTSTDQSRPILQGVRLEPAGDSLVLVSTDSYRLGIDTCPAEGAERFVPMTVPGAELGKVLKLAAKGEGPLYLSQELELRGETDVAVRLEIRDGNRQASLRFTDGTYPNWRQLIPDTFEWSMTVSAKDAGKALARMVKLAPANYPARLSSSAEALTLRLNVQHGVEIESELAAKADGDLERFPVDVGANPAFLADAVAAIGDERVRLNFINPLRPLLVTAEGWTGNGPEPGRCHLVMPVRLAG